MEDDLRNPAVCSVKVTNLLLLASVLGNYKTIDLTHFNNKLVF